MPPAAISRSRPTFAPTGRTTASTAGACAPPRPSVRAVVQRVSSASVAVGGEPVGSIGPGMLVLLGISPADGEGEARRIAEKISSLRIFDDSEGRMSEPLGDRGILCVSQFTLYGDVRKGTRPSFTAAAPPEHA